MLQSRCSASSETVIKLETLIHVTWLPGLICFSFPPLSIYTSFSLGSMWYFCMGDTEQQTSEWMPVCCNPYMRTMIQPVLFPCAYIWAMSGEGLVWNGFFPWTVSITIKETLSGNTFKLTGFHIKTSQTRKTTAWNGKTLLFSAVLDFFYWN